VALAVWRFGRIEQRWETHLLDWQPAAEQVEV
jgi:hypothetical protein